MKGLIEPWLTFRMAGVRLAGLEGPKWTSSGQNPVQNEAILDHLGPVRFPTVIELCGGFDGTFLRRSPISGYRFKISSRGVAQGNVGLGNVLGSGGWSLSDEQTPMVGFGKRGLLEGGSFQESPFSRDSRF